ncbi:MAG: FUN14 domain-containing protein [Campylobacterota bacterium]|nr:FUN14 domain-containing protein [Campylobacterota bacterium]
MEQTTPQEETLIPYLDMGTGFLIGLAVGYTLKKSFKLLLFVLGIYIIAIFVLENKGMMSINEASLENTVSNLASKFKEFVVFLKDRLSSFQFSKGISSVAGFILGLKIG